MNILCRIKERVTASEFLKSVSVLFSGNVIANAISFISIPILSRVYSQTDFGDYAIVTSVATIVSVSTTFGLTSAIMAPKEDHESKRILTTAYIIQSVLIIAFASILVLLYVIQNIQLYRFSGNYLISLILLFLYLLVSALFSLLTILTNKQKQNRVLFRNALINSLSSLVLTIPLGLLGFGGAGFILGASCSYLISDMQMIIHTRPFVHIDFRTSCREIVKKYRDFIIYQFPANILGTFTHQLPNQLFSRLFGNARLGGYAMCDRILGVPMRLIGSPISTVYFRQASIYVKEQKDLSLFTYRLISKILWYSFLPVVLGLFFARPIFTLILGTEWTEVGDIVSLLLVPYILSFCSSCVSYCLVVINKQKINLLLTIVQLSLIGGFTLLGYYLFHDFYRTLQFYAISMILYHIVHLSTVFYNLKGYLRKFLSVVCIYLIVVLSIFLLINSHAG